MKNLWKLAEPVGLLCFLSACGVAALNVLAVIAASFGFVQPFNYFQYFRVPLWSVALPAVGILALLPLALRHAFTDKPAPEEKKAAEPEARRIIVEKRRIRLYIRSV
ncbi:MAG TPA: hypothetical protein VFV58_10250 [Blastocatellia bacterium]|jgi:hypothetical protein|nr:hypothetical protein [Blastocatellia bacterium]